MDAAVERNFSIASNWNCQFTKISYRFRWLSQLLGLQNCLVFRYYVGLTGVFDQQSLWAEARALYFSCHSGCLRANLTAVFFSLLVGRSCLRMYAIVWVRACFPWLVWCCQVCARNWNYCSEIGRCSWVQLEFNGNLINKMRPKKEEMPRNHRKNLRIRRIVHGTYEKPQQIKWKKKSERGEFKQFQCKNTVDSMWITPPQFHPTSPAKRRIRRAHQHHQHRATAPRRASVCVARL